MILYIRLCYKRKLKTTFLTYLFECFFKIHTVSACDEFCSICTKVEEIFHDFPYLNFFKIWSWKSKLRSPFWVKKNVTVILKTWKWHLLSGPDTLSVDVTIFSIFLQVILYEIDENIFSIKPKYDGWMLWDFYRFNYLKNV